MPFVHDKTVVFDNGSYESKLGFAGDAKPQAHLRSCVGEMNKLFAAYNRAMGQAFLSQRAQKMRRPLRLQFKYPVINGLIADVDAMEKVWDYSFEEKLNADSEACPVILTECPLNPEMSRAKMAEIMFKQFGVPSLAIVNSAVASIRGMGINDGILLDIGGGVTSVVPVRGGVAIKEAILQSKLCGGVLSADLVGRLEARGVKITFADPDLVLADIKEKVCYVCEDIDAEAKKPSLEMSFSEPNGHAFTLGYERFAVPEALFKPAILHECPGIFTDNFREVDAIHQLVFKSIMKCPADIRPKMFGNIVLAGGSSMFKGLPERLKKEVAAIAPPGTTVNVVANPNRKDAAFLGAAKLAADPAIKAKFVTKAEYKEKGAAVVHAKAF